MNRKLLIVVLTGLMCGSIKAQVYGNDRIVPMPVTEIYAHEQLGELRAAKSDYKTGKKYNSAEAAEALESLKARMKR